MSEFTHKQHEILSLLDRYHLDALLLQKTSSFAWATCGGSSFVNTAASEGAAKLLVTPTGRYLITNSIEAPRMEEEERLHEQGWQIEVFPWHKPENLVDRLVGSLKIGSDSRYPGAENLEAEISRMRAKLTPEEGDRFRHLGQLCAQAMREAIQRVHPGQSEYEMAALLGQAALRRGVQPVVNLIAADDRIFKYRHPIPTGKILDRYAMLVLCGRRGGLVCSITRLVHFGPVDEEIRQKMGAVARIDAEMLTATRPGASLDEVIQAGIWAYAGVGYPDEWKLHHQGGPAGYEPREYLAHPGSTDKVSAGQAYAWNPSITGTKSEDTILVKEDGFEILTEVDDWPQVRVNINGKEVRRPGVLEVE
jgi:Xaa-Pro aminopeptidase